MFAFLYNPAIAWILVVVATVIETAWFVVLKQSSGLQAWPWNLIGYLMVFLDIPLLSIALKNLPAGSVYAFWTGTSAVAIAIIGIWFFGESTSFWRLFFIGIVVIGIIGVNLTG
ncbi:MAG: SMR family transporter [Candidatus Pacebacteria bacterium]|nr:SMR family transporter [Candidatus Paceibacterota bacterium]